MLSAALLLVAVVLMGRGTRRDRFGRVVPAGAGRPIIRRECGCPTRQHRPACHHAGQTARPEVGIDRLKAKARRAARAVAARLSRLKTRARALREVPGTGTPGWLSSSAAQQVYGPRFTPAGRRPFLWARLDGRCCCCGAESTHTVSTADLRENAESIRCLCGSCSVLVARS